MQLQLAFEQFKQGKRIGGAASESGDNPVVVQTAYFTHVAFHYGVAQGGLSVSANHDLTVAAYAYNCCHEFIPVTEKKAPARTRGILTINMGEGRGVFNPRWLTGCSWIAPCL
ncbi:hypothetical protein GCM10007171_25270 [Dickeya fangzhongdai]|nr:hypothetical protein GCM10007171_25270 [Dickeya fangzhongdai]